MKISGGLYIASREINGAEYPMFYYGKLEKNKYLIVFDTIFRKNPIKRTFGIVSEKKFRYLCKGHKLQEGI